MESTENLFAFKIGDYIGGQKIIKIYARSDDFIFYRTKGTKSVSFHWRGIETACINPIAPLISEIYGLQSKITNSSKYNDQITTAHIQCILGHPQNGINILVKLKEQLYKDIIQQSKIKYLICSIFIILFNTVVSLFFYYTKNYFNTGPLREYFTVATFGSYGGFISVLYKINKLNFTEDDDKKLLFFLALSRLFISMLSSVIIYVLIKSNVILGILNNVKNVYVYYTFSVLAGFSETFVPDLLGKLEKKTTTKN